jgi:hypothetical protein
LIDVDDSDSGVGSWRRSAGLAEWADDQPASGSECRIRGIVLSPAGYLREAVLRRFVTAICP